MSVVPRQAIENMGRWLMARPLPASGPFELVYWRPMTRFVSKEIRLLGRREHAVANH